MSKRTICDSCGEVIDCPVDYEPGSYDLQGGAIEVDRMKVARLQGQGGPVFSYITDAHFCGEGCLMVQLKRIRACEDE